MGFPEKLLNEGEHVVVSTRTHVKVLIGALFVLLLTVALSWFYVRHLLKEDES